MVLVFSALKLNIKETIPKIESEVLKLASFNELNVVIQPSGILKWLPTDYSPVMKEEKMAEPVKKKSISVKTEPRKFEIKWAKAECTDENHKIYQEYCEDIHEKPEKSKSSFTNFLCLKNLIFKEEKSPIDGSVLNLGCYHMNYYLDEKLIAVGVVDVVPKGLSSVYFFYDPKYKSLKMGIIGGLYELEFIQKMQKSFPDFRYYYLGFYIQQTPKMSYKADFEPCELLCPKTKRFVELTQELRKGIDNGQRVLDQNELSPEEKYLEDFKDAAEMKMILLNHGRIKLDGQIHEFKTSTALISILSNIVKQREALLGCIGRTLVKKCVLDVDG